MSVIEIAKTGLRIGHSGLDAEINRQEGVFRKDLKRMGIKPEKAESDDDLIVEAVVTGILSKMADTQEKRDKYAEAYRIQADELRKSRGYRSV
jgi:DNA polymerase III delta prime subunit